MRKYVYDLDAKISFMYRQQDAHITSNPFNPQRCPEGYQCQGIDKADYWICWQEDCYPMMLGATNGINYTNQGGSVQGVYITTYGYFDTKLTLSITCDKRTMLKNNGYIDVNDEVSFDGENGYTVYSEWSEVCPRTGTQPEFPTPVAPLTPTPEPQPDPVEISFYDRDYGFNFNQFAEQNRKKEMSDVVFQITGMTYENASLIFDPIGKIECPAGAECKGVSYASAWKCWNDVITEQKNCVSLADARYAPVSVSSSRVLYSSGYNGYNLELDLICNLDQGIDNYSLSSVVRESKKSLTVWMSAYSAAFCKGRGLSTKPVTGGAVFLLIVILCAIVYIVGGVLFNFFTIGKFTLPNEQFWDEFINCVVAGFYGVTCRKSVAVAISLESGTDIYSTI
jgi:hypothetical protein